MRKMWYNVDSYGLFMKHKHHIVPRHMGGSDDPSNIMEVTIEQHSEAHFLLYLEHGKWEDWVACMGLSGQIGNEEIIREALSNGGKRGGSTTGKMNRESGHIHTIATHESRSRGGITSGNLAVQRGQVQSLGRRVGREKVESGFWQSLKTPEHQSRVGRIGGRIGGKISSAQRWKCTVTGYVSNAPGLSHYQRHRNIDVSNRVRIDT